MSNKADTAALLVCAGNAARMGGIHKILHSLGDTTVLRLCLSAFDACADIREMVVVCRAGDREAFERELRAAKLKIPVILVSGGVTRQQSVKNGFEAVAPDTEYVAIHDGARPLIEPDAISRVIARARVCGAAALGVPVKDTVKMTKDGVITDTPPRENLFAAQTPQVFRKALYEQALAAAAERGLDAVTDDCALAEALGARVEMVTGSYSNIKLTTPEDFAVAEALLRLRTEKGAVL